MRRYHLVGLRSVALVAAAGCALTVLAPLQPARAADPVPAATPSASETWEPGTEVVSLRDRWGSTVKGDVEGSYVSTVHSRPVNYQLADGSWQPIDLSVKSTSEGLRPTANDLIPVLGPTGSSPNLVDVAFSATQRLRFGLAGALPVGATIAGSSVTYNGILPGVDARYDLRTAGLKETLVLSGPTSPTSYDFPLQLTGLTAHQTNDGSVNLQDTSGKPIGVIPAGEMTDAHIDPHTGEPVQSSDVTYQLVSLASGAVALRVTLDSTWLHDPARQFPVEVDPSVYNVAYSDATDDAYVQSTGGYSSTDTVLKSGTFDGSDKSRSFMHFQGANTFDGRQINSATLNVWENWSYSCLDRGVRAYPIAATWDGANAMTWPGISLRSYSSSYVPEAVTANGHDSGCPAANVPFNVTQTVKYWANNTWPNYGLALVATSESDAYGWKKWDSNEASHNPSLTVNWTNSAPGQVSGRSVTTNDCVYNCTAATMTKDTTPVLRGSTTDPDAQTLRYDFEVYPGHLTTVDASGNATPGSVARLTYGSVSGLASGAAANWTVNTTLADGDYAYRVRAFDSELYGVWSSGWAQFTVDSGPPPAATITSSTHPNETAYYNASTISAAWQSIAVSGTNGYTTVLDTVTGTDPGTGAASSASSATFPNESDSCYYLHARPQSNVGTWGAASQKRMCVDATLPNAPTSVYSSTHSSNTPSNNNHVTLSASGASDPVVNQTSSGIAGEAMACNSSPSTPAGTAVSVAGASTVTWTSPTLADGEYYCHARSIDAAGNASIDVALGKYLIDTVAPAAPTPTSTQASSGSWTANTAVQFAWNTPADVSGINGYSVVLDDTASTTPPQTISTSGTTQTFSNIPDGTHYLHMRAVDKAGNWGTSYLFTLMVDASAPVAPTVGSSTHPSQIQWNSNNLPSLTFSAADLSGITGLSYVLDQNAGTIPDATLETTSSSGSYTASTAIPDGKSYFHVRARNGSGLLGDTYNYVIRVDRTAPNVSPSVISGSHSVNTPSNNQILQLSWTASPGADSNVPGTDQNSGMAGYSVIVNTSAATAADTTLDQSGTNYTYTLPGEGSYYLHIRSIDVVGNVGPDISFGPYIVDLTAPGVPVITSSTHAQNAWSPNSAASFGLSAPDNYGVNGYGIVFDETSTTVPPASVTTSLNNYTQSSIVDGTHYLHARAKDIAGNWGSGSVFTVLVDSTPPTGPVVTSSTHPDQNVWSTNNNPGFSFSANDTSGVNGFSYSLDQTAATIPGTVAQLTGSSIGSASFTNLPEGLNYFHVRARNGAGLFGTTTTYLIRVDRLAPNVAPTVASTSHTVNTPSSNTLLQLTWAAAPGADTYAGIAESGIAGYSIAINNSAATVADTTLDLAGTTYSYALPSEGDWYVHIRAIDALGNTGPDTVTGPFKLDLTPPGVPGITGVGLTPGRYTSNRTASFTFTPPTDVSGISGYSVLFDDTPTTTPPAVVTSVGPNFTQSNMTDGTHYLHVRARDAAGNWGTGAVYMVLVDATNPPAPTVQITPQQNPANWYSADGGTLTSGSNALSGISGYAIVIDKNSATDPGTTSVSTDGTKTFAALADGRWYAHVRALSGSGLISSITHMLLQVDVTAPSAPSVTSPDHDTTETTNQSIITTAWQDQPGSDSTSGVAGYSYAFNNSGTTPTDGTIDTTATQTASPTLADGTWFFHLRAIDKAGNASSDATFGPVTITQAAPPVGPIATARFIALWQPRVTSDTYGSAYLDAPGYSAGVLAEGFHGMNSVQKGYLIDQLFNALQLADPLPSELDSQAVAYIRDAVYAFVFNKDVAAATRDVADNAVGTVTGTVTSVLDTVPAIYQQVIADVDSIYDAASQLISDLPAESYDALADDFAELDPSTDELVNSALNLDTQSALDTIDVGGTDPISDVETAANQVLTDTGTVVDPTPIFDAVPPLPVSADYQACWKSGKSNGCRPGVISAPTPLDVTGDNTSDLLVTFGPTPDPSNPGIANITYTLGRFPVGSDLAGNPVRASVWINYDVGAIGKRLIVGFDGYQRGTALSESTTASVSLPDPRQISGDDLTVGYAVTHTNASDTWALSLGLRNLTGDPDPRDTSLKFTPPTNIHGQLTLSASRSGTSSARVLDITNVTDKPTVLDGTYLSATPSSGDATNTRFLVNKLPTTAHVRVERNYDTTNGTVTDVTGTASQVIGQVTLRNQSTSGSQSEVSAVDLRDVPRSTHLHLTQKSGRTSGTYDAASGDTLGRAGYADVVRTGGTLQRASSVNATSVPTSVQLGFGASGQSGDDSMLLDYHAAATMQQAAVSSYDRGSTVTFKASATQIPTLVTASASKQQGNLSLQTSTPIGQLSVTAARAGGRVMHLSGDHLTYLGSGAAFGADLTLSWLSQASFSLGDTVRGTLDLAPAGQRLRVMGQLDTVAASVDLSNTPTHTAFSLSRGDINYHVTTSGVIDTAKFYIARRPGGGILEGTLTSVPTSVDITGNLSSTAGSIAYRSDLTLGQAWVMLSSDAAPLDRTGTTVRVHAQDVPPSIDAGYDIAAKTVHLQGSAPVGLLEASISRNGAAAKKHSGDYATFTGTSSAFAGSASIHGLTKFDANLAGGVSDSTATLAVAPGGQPFVVDGTLGNDVFNAKLSNLPPTLTITAHGLQDIGLDTSAPISRFDGYKATRGTGPTFQASIQNVPTHVDVSADLTGPSYALGYAGSSGADYFRGYYSPKYVGIALDAKDKFASGWVDHPPAHATVSANTETGTLDYRADLPTRGAGLTVKDVFKPGLQLVASATGIPTAFQVSRTGTSATFHSGGLPLQTINFRASNSGTPAKRSGNHVYARTSQATGHFNVSVALTDVADLSYDSGNDQVKVISNVDLHGNPLIVDVRADGAAPNSDSNDDEYRQLVRGTITKLPDSITFTRAGTQFRYNASSRFDASNLEVDLGWIKALVNASEPLARDGVSVTDGACSAGSGCTPANSSGATEGLCDPSRNECHALRVKYNFAGMGTAVTLNTATTGRQLDVNDLAPSNSQFKARLDLDDIPSTPVFIDLTQKGISSGTNLHFGPISIGRSTDGNNALAVHLKTDHSADLGSLTAQIRVPGATYVNGDYRYSNWQGTLTVSNVPATTEFTLGAGGTSVGSLALSHVIDTIGLDVTATVGHKQSDGSFVNDSTPAHGTVHLDDIPAATALNPTTFVLTAAKQYYGSSRDFTALPSFDYWAPAGTLDLGVKVDPRLQAFSIGNVAQFALEPVDVGFTNLGRVVSVAIDSVSRQLIMTSPVGPTGSLYIKTGVDLVVGPTDISERTYPTSYLRVDTKAHVDLHLTAPKIALSATSVTSMTVTAGQNFLAYGVEGNYGTLKITTPGLRLVSDTNVDVKAKVKPYYSWMGNIFHTTLALKGTFTTLYSHVAPADAEGSTGLCVNVQIGQAKGSGYIYTRPHGSRQSNGVTIEGSEGNQVFSFLDPVAPGSDPQQVDQRIPALIEILTAGVEDPFQNGRVYSPQSTWRWGSNC